MESRRCRQVDLARATLPPGAPLDPESAAHVRSCARCQDAARLDAAIAQALRRSRPALPDAAMARIRRAVRPTTPRWVPALALAAGLVLSLVLGRALSPVVHPPAQALAPLSDDTPLLERLVARHLGQDAGAPPAGVVSETRLPETLAIGVIEEPPTRTAMADGAPRDGALCPVDAEPGRSTLYVLDRAQVDVEPDLEKQLAGRGVVSVMLDGQRVTMAESDRQLFVTVTSTDRGGQLAGR